MTLVTRMHQPLSVDRAIAFAWPAFKKHRGLFTAILLTILGAWGVLEVIVIAGQRFGLLLWVAAHLAFLVFFAGVEAGMLQTSLVLYDGGEPTFADTFRHLASGPRLLLAQVMYGSMVLVGLLFLVVPGLYLGARYTFFGFRLVNGGADLVQSFKQSAMLSAGARTRLFGILASLFLLNVLGASLLGVGLFVTVPLTLLMMTALYRQLRAPERS